jgi:hypothetical protein
MQREPVFMAQCRRHAKGRLAHTHDQQPQRFACVKDAEVGPSFFNQPKNVITQKPKNQIKFRLQH